MTILCWHCHKGVFWGMPQPDDPCYHCGNPIGKNTEKNPNAQPAVTEIEAGPFVFEWDEKNHQMFISKGEEQLGMVEHVDAEAWDHFVLDFSS